MDDGQQDELDNKLPFYGDRRFLILIILSIIASVALIMTSMMLYRHSGAAQLDLSRPGYKDIRDKITTKDDSFLDFSTTGAVNSATINEFRLLYSQQAEKAKSVDAFGGDPLDPAVLWSNINLQQ